MSHLNHRWLVVFAVTLALFLSLPLILAPQNGEEITKQAEQGNAEAQFNLGVLYANGESVKRDTPTAYALFLLATQQGDEKAKKV